jgi:hypothetical protein
MRSMTANTLVPPASRMFPFLRRHQPVWYTSLLSGLGLLLGSCARSLPPPEYRAYLADPAHGLTHATETNGVTITCAYRPLDLLVLQDLGNIATATPSTRDSLARAYVDKTYCSLTLSRNGSEIETQFVNDPAAYQQALTYLNTGIAADAYLATTPQDSVPAIASMYVRQYGTTGHSTLLLVFDTHNLTPQQGFHLTLHGQRLGLGTLHFPFAATDLAGLPPLKFN